MMNHKGSALTIQQTSPISRWYHSHKQLWSRNLLLNSSASSGSEVHQASKYHAVISMWIWRADLWSVGVDNVLQLSVIIHGIIVNYPFSCFLRISKAELFPHFSVLILVMANWLYDYMIIWLHSTHSIKDVKLVIRPYTATLPILCISTLVCRIIERK